jgi:hypothetical protein
LQSWSLSPSTWFRGCYYKGRTTAAATFLLLFCHFVVMLPFYARMVGPHHGAYYYFIAPLDKGIPWILLQINDSLLFGGSLQLKLGVILTFLVFGHFFSRVWD